MSEKLTAIIILLMAMLNLLPTLFVDTLYHDNIYYTIMYLLLSYTALVIPFIVSSLNRILSAISMMLGGWFVAGLMFELFNWFVPEQVLNSMDKNSTFNSFLIMFIIGVSFIITRESWIKQQK